MKPFGCILLCILFLACGDRAAIKNISIEHKTSSSGNHYTIIYQNDCKIAFTNIRPSEKDTDIKLCIAAAFTRLDNGAIDGTFMIDGKKGDASVNKSIGGGMTIINGKASIASTGKGSLITDAFLKKLSKQKASFFQQIQLIENSNAASFKDKAYFQRRAIVIFNNGKYAVAECEESMLLADFSKDLVELGVKDALYTDMGGWDEGWYRDPKTGKKTIIGLMRTSTSKQSNWVTFTLK